MKSLQHIRGVFRRHFFLWLRNPEYFFDTFWQPVVDVLIWGFVTTYLSRASEKMSALISFFLGAIILWTILRRGQHEVTFTFMEEAWSRNIQNMLTTPINIIEYLSASVMFGIVKLAIEISIMGFLVSALFKFNFLVLGFSLVPFAISLIITGWALGLIVTALIIYFGRGMVALSWIVAFAIQPFACVFYPLSALPVWAQPIAKSFPATWVFEGMRGVLAGDGIHIPYLINSFVLNAIYLGAGYFILMSVLRIAMDKGLMMKLEW